MDQQKVDRPFRVGVFDTVAQADHAVHRLLNAGFSKDELAIICSDKHKEHLFEQEHLRTLKSGDASYTAEAIPAGAGVGAVIGGIALAAMTIATGGVGLLAAATVLVGGGALAGSFAGAMMTRADEPEISLYYAQAVELGKILVAIEVHGPNKEARLALADRVLAGEGTQPVPLVEG